MPRLVTVVKVTLMGLPSKNSSGRVWPPTAAVGKATASTSGTRRVPGSFSREDSDTDDHYTELSSSSSDEVWLYSCIYV